MTDAEGRPSRRTKRRTLEEEIHEDNERSETQTPDNFARACTPPMKACSNSDVGFVDFTSKELMEDSGRDDNVSTSFDGNRNKLQKVEDDVQRGGRGREQVYGDRGLVKTTTAQDMATAGLPMEVSEISSIAPQDGRSGRRFSTEAGVFMEEEVVALSVLVSLRY